MYVLKESKTYSRRLPRQPSLVRRRMPVVQSCEEGMGAWQLPKRWLFWSSWLMGCFRDLIFVICEHMLSWICCRVIVVYVIMSLNFGALMCSLLDCTHTHTHTYTYTCTCTKKTLTLNTHYTPPAWTSLVWRRLELHVRADDSFCDILNKQEARMARRQRSLQLPRSFLTFCCEDLASLVG